MSVIFFQVRDVLLSFMPIVRYLGQFIVYMMGSFLPWRQCSFICAALPIATVMIMYFVSDQQQTKCLFKYFNPGKPTT